MNLLTNTSKEICNCDCHRSSSNMKHVVACCQQCPKCHQNIVPIYFDAHVESCGVMAELLEKIVEEKKG